MSFEPTILIKLDDLNKHQELFELTWEWSSSKKPSESEQKVLKYLRDLYKEDDMYILDAFGVKCRTCTPDGTSFNKSVRAKLH